jgi:hypothetical protein
MRKASMLIGSVTALILATPGVDAATMNKCVVNGTVTYQQGPCPSEQPGKRPTLEELNAEAKKQREAAASAPPAAPAASVVPSAFHCDGRQYCSQMRSCEEAKYFLANCPGAKMDGDKNGIPCEKQWCNR